MGACEAVGSSADTNFRRGACYCISRRFKDQESAVRPPARPAPGPRLPALLQDDDWMFSIGRPQLTAEAGAAGEAAPAGARDDALAPEAKPRPAVRFRNRLPPIPADPGPVLYASAGSGRPFSSVQAAPPLPAVSLAPLPPPAAFLRDPAEGRSRGGPAATPQPQQPTAPAAAAARPAGQSRIMSQDWMFDMRRKPSEAEEGAGEGSAAVLPHLPPAVDPRLAAEEVLQQQQHSQFAPMTK